MLNKFASLLLLPLIFLSNMPNAAARPVSTPADPNRAASAAEKPENDRSTGSFAPATVVWEENFDGVTAPALPPGWTTVTTGQYGAPAPFATVANQADSAPNVAVTGGFWEVSTNGLVSPPITLPILQTYFQLSFRQTFNFENTGSTCWDGGVLQLSTNGGTTYNDVTSAAVGAVFVANGYNGTISTNSISRNPLAGQAAFCGFRSGYVTTILALPLNLAGHTVKFRWLGAWDSQAFRPDPNWRIDSISLTSAQAPPLNITVDTPSGNPAQNACTAAANDCSLPGAISRTNGTPGNDTISFDPAVFATPQTISLGGAPLVVDNQGALTITGPGPNLVTIDANYQSQALILNSGGSLDISGFTFARGNAINIGGSSGGAVVNNGGSLTIGNSAIVDSRALNNGGGISAAGVTTLTNCTISGNTAAGGGGGIEIAQGGSLTLTNSTVSGNTAANGGGGILTSEATTIVSSTIAANTAGAAGGGISQQDDADVGLLNTIVAANSAATAPDFGGTVLSQGWNLIGSTSGATVTGTTTGNILDQDAKLLPLLPNNAALRTHALLPDSPAVNAGTSVNTPALDQRGKARVGAADIGAYEAGANLVVTNTANSGTGSLRAAIDFANGTAADESITFNIPTTDPGCAGRVCTIALTGGQLAVANNGTLIVSNRTGAANLRVSGNNAGRVLLVNGGANLTLREMTLTNGSVGGDNGGGVRNDGTLTALSCIIAGNSVSNNPGGGGGIANNGTMELLNAIVSGNSSNDANSSGGGILNGGALNLTNSTVSGNSANAFNSRGGGISNSGTLNVTNSTVSGNSAGVPYAGNNAVGGGIANGGTLNLTNSTVSGNTSDGGGGGLYVTNTGTINLTNSTVAANDTTNFGCGVYNAGGFVYSRGSIIAGNGTAFATEFNGQFNSQGYNLIGNTAGIFIVGDTTGNILDQPARLAPLGNYGGPTETHALLANSPAVDAGDPANSPARDQRGAARSGTADIGAFELNNTANGGTFVAALPGGTQNAPYDYTLAANDNGFTYSITAGSLPNGLSLTTSFAGNAADRNQTDFAPAAAVALSGTPTQPGTFSFTVTATSGASSTSTNYSLFVLGPSAAAANVGGRVLTADGRAVANATVTMTDATGAARAVRTGSFGYFAFDGVRTGETYVFEVVSKRCTFAPRAVTIDDGITDLNLIAQ